MKAVIGVAPGNRLPKSWLTTIPLPLLSTKSGLYQHEGLTKAQNSLLTHSRGNYYSIGSRRLLTRPRRGCTGGVTSGDLKMEISIGGVSGRAGSTSARSVLRFYGVDIVLGGTF